jgi:hypothetical protein
MVRIQIKHVANTNCYYVDPRDAASRFNFVFDALKHLQAESAAELDAWLPAILDCAFKGEL